MYHDASSNAGGYAFHPPSTRSNMDFKKFSGMFRSHIAQAGRVPFQPASTLDAAAGDVTLPATDVGVDTHSAAPAEPSPSAAMLAALAVQEGSAPAAPAATGGGTAAQAAGTATPPVPPHAGSHKPSRVYMQQSLTDGVGAQMQADFAKFNWPLANALAKRNEWGPLTSNLLLVGEQGCVTPLHYDEQHNLFAQVAGRKLCVLASPANFGSFYPFPVGHPHDRQAQVNTRRPDTRAFPNFTAAKFVYTVLSPGDVLYIPSYWWHEIHSSFEDTVSVNFFFFAVPTGTPTLPLTDHTHLVALRRNIEKLMGQTHGFTTSTRFFERLGSAEGITLATASQSDRDMIASMLKLLGMVLASTQLEPFVLELARGRFALPRADTPSLGGLPPSTPLLRAAIAQLLATAASEKAAGAGGAATTSDSHHAGVSANGGGAGDAIGSAASTEMASLTQHLRRAAVTETVRAHKLAQGSLGHAMGIADAGSSLPADAAVAADAAGSATPGSPGKGARRGSRRAGKKRG